MNLKLKPCPNTECNRTGNLHRIIGVDTFWVGCTSCGLEGPAGETEEEGDYLWNLMPRKDDDKGEKEKHRLPIRVKLYKIEEAHFEPGRKEVGSGWIIGFGSEYGGNTKAIVERDNGEFDMISIKNIEVDNGTEQEKT